MLDESWKKILVEINFAGKNSAFRETTDRKFSTEKNGGKINKTQFSNSDDFAEARYRQACVPAYYRVSVNGKIGARLTRVRPERRVKEAA